MSSELKPISISERASRVTDVTAITSEGVLRVSKGMKWAQSSDIRVSVDLATFEDLVRFTTAGVVAVLSAGGRNQDLGAMGPIPNYMVDILSPLRRAKEIINGRTIRRRIRITEELWIELSKDKRMPAVARVPDDLDVTEFQEFKRAVSLAIEDAWSNTPIMCDQTLALDETGVMRVLKMYVNQDDGTAYTTEGLTTEEFYLGSTLGLEGDGKLLYDVGYALKYAFPR
jgi:hypothetical protein